MEKRKILGISKRVLSLVLSIMMLVGVLYIPKVATTVKAEAEMPTGWTAPGDVPHITESNFKYHRGIRGNDGYSVPSNTPLATANTGGTAHPSVTLYFEYVSSGDYPAIYCIEPNAGNLPTYGGENFVTHFDGPMHGSNKLPVFTDEQAKLLSYALALAPATYPRSVLGNSPTSTWNNPLVTAGNSTVDVFARGVAAQLTMWTISQGWYKNGNIYGPSGNMSAMQSIHDIFLQNYPNVQSAWNEIWNELKVYFNFNSNGTVTDRIPDQTYPTDTLAIENKYEMRWDYDENTYKITLNTDIANIGNYWEVDPSSIDGTNLNVTFSGSDIIVTGDPGELQTVKFLKLRLKVDRVVVAYLCAENSIENQNMITRYKTVYKSYQFSYNSECWIAVWRDVACRIQKTFNPTTSAPSDKSGFQFKIWAGSDTTGTPITKSGNAIFTTDTYGQILLKKTELNYLEPGTYYVEEQSVPGKTDGYYLAKKTITVGTGTLASVNTQYIENKETTVIVEKDLEGKDTSGLSKAGYRFEVYAYNTEASPKGAYIATVGPTGSDGQITLYGAHGTEYGPALPAGEYWFVEVEQDDPDKPGYTGPYYQTVAGKVTVDNTKDETPTYTFTNSVVKIEVNKDIEERAGEESKEGFGFYIYAVNGAGTGPDESKLIAYGVTKGKDTEDGTKYVLMVNKAALKDDSLDASAYNYEIDGTVLPKGEYWVRERLTAQSRKYYLIDTKIEIKNNNGEMNYYVLENKLIEIKPVKEVDERVGQGLAGFEFDIYEYEPELTANVAAEGSVLGDPVVYVVTDAEGVALFDPANPLGDTSKEIKASAVLHGGIMHPGHYWVRERLTAQSRKYYLIDEEIEVEAGILYDPAKQTDKDYMETLIQYFPLRNELLEIKPTKEVNREGDTLDGFEFDIYGMNEAGDGPDLGKKIAYVVTDDTGLALFDPENPKGLSEEECDEAGITPSDWEDWEVLHGGILEPTEELEDGTSTGEGHYWVRERLTARSRKYYLIDEEITVYSMTTKEQRAEEGNNTPAKERINYWPLLNELIEIKPVKEVDDRLSSADKSGFEFDIYEYNPELAENKAKEGSVLGARAAYAVTDEEGIAKIDPKSHPAYEAGEDEEEGATPFEEWVYVDGWVLPVREEEDGSGWYWVKERQTEKSKRFYLIDEAICVTNVKGEISNAESYDNNEDGTIQYFPIENELRKVTIEKSMADEPRDKGGIRFRIFPSKFVSEYKAGRLRWSEIIAGRDSDPDNVYYAEEFAVDGNGNYDLVGIPEGMYWIEEQAHDKNVGYWLIDEEMTICESGYYIDDGELVKFGGEIDKTVASEDRRYIIKPLLNEIIYVNATIEKVLQNSGGRVVTPSRNAEYEIVLKPYGLPDNRKEYTIVLNSGNSWRATMSIAWGSYTIEEVRGGLGYMITYSPTAEGTSNRVEIKENGVTLTVTNRERGSYTPGGGGEGGGGGGGTTPDPTTTTGTTEGGSEPGSTTVPGGSEPEGTTEVSPEGTTESATQPTIDEEDVYESVRERVPLANGWYAEYDEEDDLWYIYDEDGTPLGTVKLPEGMSIEEYDFGDWYPPLGNIPSGDDRPNPPTGDFWLYGVLMLAVISVSLTLIILRRKRRFNY